MAYAGKGVRHVQPAVKMPPPKIRSYPAEQKTPEKIHEQPEGGEGADEAQRLYFVHVYS